MRGEDGLLLYRMLWGYNPGQLKEGAAGQLVGYLDHEALDFRVLAFENLRRVTGFTLTYQPNYTEARRRTPVRRWRERLEKGGIAYKAPPTPLPQPGPSAEPAADTPVVDDGP
jgi:hypothetical protein